MINCKRSISLVIVAALVLSLAFLSVPAFAAETYTLTFVLDGGTWEDGSTGGSETGSSGDCIQGINVPVRDGYTFAGWELTGAGEYDSEANEFTFGEGNAVLTALWTSSGSSSSYYVTTVTIDGVTFTFTGSETRSPDVTMTLDRYAIELSNSSQAYTADGGDNFAGLATVENGEAVYLPDNEYTLSGSYSVSCHYVLYSVTSETVYPDYTILPGNWSVRYAVLTGELNDMTAWPSDAESYSLNFTCGTDEYDMIFYTYLPTYGHVLCYGQDTVVYSYDDIDVEPDPFWLDNGYVTIYVPTAQTVSAEFYNWFVANFYQGTGSGSGSYTTTINIYDNTGLQLLTTWTATAAGSAPSYTFVVLENGISLTSPGRDAWIWNGTGDEFYGFALSAGSTSPAFEPGETSSFTGASQDFTLSLYIVDELSEKVYRADVLGWLQKLWDKIVELPELLRKAIFGEDVLDAVNEASTHLDSTGVFRLAFQSLYAGFGLVDLFEDPAGPFAWLNG